MPEPLDQIGSRPQSAISWMRDLGHRLADRHRWVRGRHDPGHRGIELFRRSVVHEVHQAGTDGRSVAAGGRAEELKDSPVSGISDVNAAMGHQRTPRNREWQSQEVNATLR